jgi:hypothetical protein
MLFHKHINKHQGIFRYNIADYTGKGSYLMGDKKSKKDKAKGERQKKAKQTNRGKADTTSAPSKG